MSTPTPRDDGRPASLKRNRLLKVGFWLLLIPLLVFAASNIWLSSPWGTGMAEQKLKERTGMDWSVESMTWSPWNGFTVRGAKMFQPEELREHLDQPLLKVESIQVQPYWGPLLRGQARPREVTMHGPKLMVSVEMLAALASHASQQEVLPEPEKAITKPTPPKPAKKPTAKPQSPKSAKPPIAKKPAAPKPKPPAEIKRPPAGLPVRLRIQDARVEIVSATKNIELLDANGIDIDLPVFGEDASGIIKLASLKIPGINPIHDIEQAVVWRRPYLEIEEQTIDLGDFKIRGIAQLGMSRSRPFLIDLAIDPQQLEKVNLLERFAIDVKAAQLKGRLKMSGSLTSPMSWQAAGMVYAENLQIKEHHGNNVIRFDEFSVPAVFQHGNLRWNSARLIGEDISVLGNGSVSISEGVNSVTRLVASPEIATKLHAAMLGAKMLNNRSWWADLDTPDRKYRDIYIHGSLVDPTIDLGTRHEEMPLWQTLAATMHFIRVEMKEEGVELKSIPNKELLKTHHHANH